MTDIYNAFIIGTGAAGTTFAYRRRDSGMKVGIADCRELGGTCALRGCVPKKVLTGVASIVDAHNIRPRKGAGP
ncbi:FAD-dependent oxidoreductase [Methanolobus chelungpuianus]|uniref:FAD-dependent oxidoreductase n=1 Tax=Methanolobus chelungpuianus TaxID=502115 RepID=UPI002113CF4B|nr:FAD-dependent oxidoreductase [Methanolobus chelungpuianus]